MLTARIRRQHASPPPAAQLDTLAAFLENLFVGRVAEHQAVMRLFSAAGGQPQVIVLRGEPGIGRTSLAREFLAWEVAQGAETLHGRAFESCSHQSYGPLIEAIGPRLKRENVLKDLLGGAWVAPRPIGRRACDSWTICNEWTARRWTC